MIAGLIFLDNFHANYSKVSYNHYFSITFNLCYQKSIEKSSGRDLPVLVIGFGGGSLTLFLHTFFKKVGFLIIKLNE